MSAPADGVSLGEAARLTGRDRSTIARAIQAGKLPNARKVGEGITAAWAVPLTDLEAAYGPLTPDAARPSSSATTTAVTPIVGDLLPLLERLSNAEREAVEHRYALEAERERHRVALERATSPARSTLPLTLGGLAALAWAAALATLPLLEAVRVAVPAIAGAAAVAYGAWASRRP